MNKKNARRNWPMLVAGLVLSVGAWAAGAANAAPSLGGAEQGEALLSRIEAKWSGVMTRIRGWDTDALRQFREGYRSYPASVLEEALAAETFEEMQEALNGYAGLRAQSAMQKAFAKSYALDVTLPGDASDAEVVAVKTLAAKTLGDDARDLVFIPVAPCTVWDTRFAASAPFTGAIGAGVTRQFYSHLDGAGGNFTPYGGNPACTEANQTFLGARPYAAMMIVYVNNPVGSGWLTFYRDGDPDASLATISVYYSPGPTRTQTVISKSSRGYGAGTYDIAVTGRYSTADASASVVGYFLKAVNPTTVTSVGTGAGLTGGPITSTGTINLAATNLLPTVACAANQIPKWSGAAWACAADLDTNSGGTVTSITAGTGLTGGTITTTGTIGLGTVAVANGGTGQTTLTSNGVLYGQGTTAVATAVGAAGQVLAGTASAPAWTGDPSLSGNLYLVNSTATTGNILKGGAPFIHNYGFSNTFIGENAGNFAMSGNGNTASGSWALNSNTTGSSNTVSGESALVLNTTGSWNTASGSLALTANTTGDGNSAYGNAALHNSTAGGYNTASGSGALFSNTTGGYNSAIGVSALSGNTTGSYNTAFGIYALNNNTTGESNIAFGGWAGTSLTTGNYNIAIGNAGVAGESATIRIGDSNQTRTFISGIRGITTAGAAVAVLVDANGQLGTISSSRRFKDDIADMDQASSSLMKLRPVTFHYKTDRNPTGRVLQYGLIAEEVAEVYPGLVARSADGQIETVMYQHLPSMLLNEYQKQHHRIQVQTQDAATHKARVARLEQDRDMQTARIAELEREHQAQSAEIAGLKAAAAQVAELKQQMAHMARLLDRERGGAVTAELNLK